MTDREVLDLILSKLARIEQKQENSSKEDIIIEDSQTNEINRLADMQAKVDQLVKYQDTMLSLIKELRREIDYLTQKMKSPKPPSANVAG